MVVSTHTPGQCRTYRTHAEAAAHIYALALPADFSGHLENDRPLWLLYLSLWMLEKNVRVRDLVYVDHSGFYTGGVVLPRGRWTTTCAGERRMEGLRGHWG
jgi:hypothetical protein